MGNLRIVYSSRFVYRHGDRHGPRIHCTGSSHRHGRWLFRYGDSATDIYKEIAEFKKLQSNRPAGRFKETKKIVLLR